MKNQKKCTHSPFELKLVSSFKIRSFFCCLKGLEVVVNPPSAAVSTRQDVFYIANMTLRDPSGPDLLEATR